MCIRDSDSTVPSMFSMNRAVAMIKGVRIGRRMGTLGDARLWRRGRGRAIDGLKKNRFRSVTMG